MPVNDLKSSGFLDNIPYESNERTDQGRTNGHKVFCCMIRKTVKTILNFGR